MSQQLDYLSLRGLEYECIVGIYPEERKRSQALQLDLDLGFSFLPCVKNHCLSHSVDYASLRLELAFLLEASRFELLETAAECISKFIMYFQPMEQKRAQVESVKLRLRKPQALPGLAYPELSIERRPKATVEDAPVECLDENGNCSLLHVRMAAGERLSFAPGVDAHVFTWSKSLLELSHKPLASARSHRMSSEGHTLLADEALSCLVILHTSSSEPKLRLWPRLVQADELHAFQGLKDKKLPITFFD